MNVTQVLDDDERRAYLRDTASIEFIVTNDHARPVGGKPDDLPVPSAKALARAVAIRHDEKPDLVTTGTMHGVLAARGLIAEPGGGLPEAGDDDANYAVVLGAIAGREGIPVREACLLACHEFVSALLGAAQRLLALGSTEIQRVLDDLRPVMVEAVEDSAGRSLSAMTPFAPLIELASADHERADRRLFVS
jgi:hypothetical protein